MISALWWFYGIIYIFVYSCMFYISWGPHSLTSNIYIYIYIYIYMYTFELYTPFIHPLLLLVVCVLAHLVNYRNRHQPGFVSRVARPVAGVTKSCRDSGTSRACLTDGSGCSMSQVHNLAVIKGLHWKEWQQRRALG